MNRIALPRTPTPTPTKPYVADPQLIAAITGKPVDQCRIHPMHLKPCDTCRNGCDCDGSPERPGCGHFACFGPAEVTTAIPRCYGVAYEKARKAALSGEREQAQIAAARRRYDGSLPRVIAAILTAAGLPVTTPELAA